MVAERAVGECGADGERAEHGDAGGEDAAGGGVHGWDVSKPHPAPCRTLAPHVSHRARGDVQPRFRERR